MRGEGRGGVNFNMLDAQAPLSTNKRAATDRKSAVGFEDGA